MGINWPQLLRQPQTYLLLLGTGIGYAGLIALAGPRPAAWLSGGGIAVAMVGGWAVGFRQPAALRPSPDDLLAASVLQQQLEHLEQRVPHPRRSPWVEVRGWAEDARRFAERICDRDPLMRADLLEALHTVLDLAGQVAAALQVMDHIETPAYQKLAEKRLRTSCDRMAATHAQLQQLQDQVALSALEPNRVAGTALPQRLQTLVAANRQILNTIESEETTE